MITGALQLMPRQKSAFFHTLCGYFEVAPTCQECHARNDRSW
jgi:hypothetical protein